MSQIMTMAHGSGPWFISCRLDHDHGPNHDILGHGPMSHEFADGKKREFGKLFKNTSDKTPVSEIDIKIRYKTSS